VDVFAAISQKEAKRFLAITTFCFDTTLMTPFDL